MDLLPINRIAFIYHNSSVLKSSRGYTIGYFLAGVIASSDKGNVVKISDIEMPASQNKYNRNNFGYIERTVQLSGSVLDYLRSSYVITRQETLL